MSEAFTDEMLTRAAPAGTDAVITTTRLPESPRLLVEMLAEQHDTSVHHVIRTVLTALDQGHSVRVLDDPEQQTVRLEIRQSRVSA